MFMEERQKDILRRINESGRILVSQIQELYLVSADCARRDLRLLESKGLVERTYGGAIAVVPKKIYPEQDYDIKDLDNIRSDDLAVAKKAVSHIKNHEVVYITSSSVGNYMAVQMTQEIQVTVLTNSVTIADILRRRENISVIMLGGEMSHMGYCHDFYTIQMVKNIRLDKAFLSHSAISLEFGASISDSAGAEFGRAVMEQSSMNIGLYPSETIGRNSIHSVCTIEDYDLLITDNHVPENFLKKIRESGIDIEIAEV